MQQKKTVIVIAGPTAVGKTSVAIDVARHFNTQIISADSRQCFKELSIGVARPSVKELSAVTHHFIASHSIQQKVTAVTFEAYALEKAAAVFATNNIVVLVGGTGLYIKAFCQGMDVIPEVPAAIHHEVVAAYLQNGLPWLQTALQQADPLFFERGETKNPQRMMRALEVIKATGQSITGFQKGEKRVRDFDVIKIALHLPKEVLHANINNRVDAMMEQGLLAEVTSMLPWQHLNALQTVGYKELFSHLNKECSLPDAIGAIKQHTRQYAKRQMTWFKKDEEYKWCLPDSDAVWQHLKTLLP